MNLIAHISVRDIGLIDTHKFPISEPFFNIFTWNFQNRFRIEKKPLLYQVDFGGQIPKLSRDKRLVPTKE